MAIESNGLVTLLKGAAQDKTDAKGLYLATNGKGGGSWKYQYKRPVSGTKNRLTYGKCWTATDGNKTQVLGMGLAEARLAHQKAREQLAAGIDPASVRDEQEAAQEAAEAKRLADAAAAKEAARDARQREALGKAPKDSYADCVERWAEKNKTRFVESTLNAAKWSQARHAFPIFGDKHINEVTEIDIAKLHTAMKDIPSALREVRRIAGYVFAWALKPEQEGLRALPSPIFKDEDLYLEKPETESHPALTEVEDVRKLMVAVYGPVRTPQYQGVKNVESFTTQRAAVRLLAMTGQRSHNIAAAEKAHFDLPAQTWTIPAILMKGKLVTKRKSSRKAHVVYLSRQAVELLSEQFDRHPDSPFVFPGNRTNTGHLARQQLGEHLIHLGFKGKQSAHGFRATMRTAGAEYAGLNPLVLETMLAHDKAKQGAGTVQMLKMVQDMLDGGMPGVYSRETKSITDKWEKQCREVMQGWSDWIDQLVARPLTLVPGRTVDYAEVVQEQRRAA